MVRGACLAAAILIVATTGSIGVGAAAGELEDALAQEWFWSPLPSQQTRRPKRAKAKDQDQERIQLLLFSGVDLWRHAAFAHDGLLWTPAGAGSDGFVFKVIASTGTYRYRSGALGDAEVTGWMAGAAVMPGLYFKRHGVSVTMHAGVDLQAHILSRPDPGNDLHGRRVGARVAIDLWAEPTPQSMITASATMTTIRGHYAARAAAGWRLLDSFYLGPEVIIYGAPDYRQLRFGAHVTGLQTHLFDWRFEWQGGVGFAFDDDGNRGAYGRLGILWRH